MKKQIAIASAILAASSYSFAEIALTESLSVEGFVDMSYSHADDDANTGSESTNSYSVDQVEFSFLLNYDAVSAQVDLEYSNSDALIDQAFVAYDLGNGSTVTAGRIDSMLGFEAFEPTGMYQNSYAYQSAAEELADADITFSDIITPGTNNAIKYTFDTDGSSFGIALQDGGFFGDNRLGGDDDGDALSDLLAELTGTTGTAITSHAVEVSYKQDLGNGLSAFAGYLSEEATVNDVDIDSSVLNLYATLETGAWIFAAEYIDTNHDVKGVGEIEIDAFLLLANYSYSDQASLTARYSQVEINDFAEGTKLTLANNYAITDNLLLVTELSTVDYDYDTDVSGDTLEGAVELLFTF